MSQIAEDIRSYLIAQAGVATLAGARIHQAKAPQGYGGTFAVFFRRQTENEDELNASLGEAAFREFFDVECVSIDLDESQRLADAIKAVTHNLEGSFGSGLGTVQGVFVRDQDDQYEPRISDEDGALHVAALDVEIVGYEEPE